tara:strand:- start:128679 stop:129290 length:612 start_codon:yes stop_codon:yes gene_type:complete
VKSKNLLLIFTRNPELGKCKTRLAKTIGDEKALEIYKFLLNHTVTITKALKVVKQVYYSETIWENDIWDNEIYQKKIQNGSDLGIRMKNAFKNGFDDGFEKIIVIGSDMYDLNENDIENAFIQLDKSEFVIGPAEDGGYYLLGMKLVEPSLFKNKKWGTATVLKDTLIDLTHKKVKLLETRNDVDIYDDIKDLRVFQPFLKNI